MRRSAAFLIVPLLTASLSGQQAAPPTGGAPAGPTGPEIAAALKSLLANDARLRDWGQLGRYREQNRTLGKPGASESRVVFMGDSITDAWPQARFGDFFANNKSYVGRGISAQTTPQMLIRFRPDVIDLNPRAVVILAGTNDIAGNTGPMSNEDIQGNLMSMAELARAHKIKVILSSILPTSHYHVAPNGVPQTQTRPMARIRALNDWMKQYAAANGHVYLDYFSAMIDQSGVMKTELTNDDLHPNAAGYAVMMPLAQAAIDRALR